MLHRRAFEPWQKASFYINSLSLVPTELAQLKHVTGIHYFHLCLIPMVSKVFGLYCIYDVFVSFYFFFLHIEQQESIIYRTLETRKRTLGNCLFGISICVCACQVQNTQSSDKGLCAFVFWGVIPG